MATSTKQLKEERAALIEKAKRFELERRDSWTADDQSAFDAMLAEIDARKQRINSLENLTAEFDGLSRASNHAPPPEAPVTRPSGGSNGGGMTFRDPSTGQILRALTPADSFSSGQSNIRAGEVLAARLLNDTSGLDYHEMRLAGAINTGDEGGLLVPGQLSSQFIDLARARSVCIGAGAMTVPMRQQTLTFAGLSSDPTAHWRRELAAITASNPSFNAVVLDAKMVAAEVPISIEGLQDQANIGSVVENALTRCLGLALDLACLAGIGASGQPTGIKNWTGVNSITSVGVPTYEDIIAAIGDVLAANFPEEEIPELAWIRNPRETETYATYKDGEGNYLVAPPWVQAMKGRSTTSISTEEGGGSNESSMYVGDFRQMVIGMRQELIIEVLREGTVTFADGSTFNATSQFGKNIVAYLRADVGILRPTWFTKLEGVTTS